LNHPGWDDDRYCHNGLLDYADERGKRLFYEPLLREIELQTELFEDKQYKKRKAASAGGFALTY
jgi:hypothetical protein